MENPENLPYQEDLAARRTELAGSPPYENFLHDLRRQASYTRDFAEKAAASTLCIFEQELAAASVKDPDANLPAALVELVRGCSRPGEQPPEAFDPETLIYSVGADLDLDGEAAEGVIRNVFAAVRKQLTHGQVGFVARKLPAKIQNLWYGHAHADPAMASGIKPRDR